MVLEIIKILAFKIHILEHGCFSMNVAAYEWCQVPDLVSTET